MTAARSTKKQQLAVRIRTSVLDHLRRRVRETGVSQTDLAERYLEEGLRADEHPLVVFRDGPMGRRPGLTGSRLDVWQVVDTVKQNGSVEEAADYLQLPVEKVQAAMRYYAAYTAEVDDWARRLQDIAEREQSLWRRQQGLVG